MSNLVTPDSFKASQLWQHGRDPNSGFSGLLKWRNWLKPLRSNFLLKKPSTFWLSGWWSLRDFTSNFYTLLGTNISHQKSLLSRWFFLFPRWNMLVPWRVAGTSLLNCLTVYVIIVGKKKKKTFQQAFEHAKPLPWRLMSSSRRFTTHHFCRKMLALPRLRSWLRL